MNNTILSLILLLSTQPAVAFAQDGGRSPAAAQESFVLDDDTGFDVKVDSEKKEVEVVQKQAAVPAAQELRLRVKGKRKVVNLRPVEPKQSPQRYVGRAPDWNESYVGLQLEISFDGGKIWKKLKKGK